MKRGVIDARRWGWIALALTAAAAQIQAGSARVAACQKVVLSGEVGEGQEWRGSIGQGWVFRVLPIAKGPAGYSGWDLVVDRERPAGFPDALMLATPPYDSINEREVGTTFGLRAQDAIGWNPRSFHFLTDPEALRESQKLFQVLGAAKFGMESPVVSEGVGMATQRQLKLNQKASTGEFRIVEARLTPGVADAAPFAQGWAMALPRTPHRFEPAGEGRSTALGELRWIRFIITLWVPGAWALPPALHGVRTACME